MKPIERNGKTKYQVETGGGYVFDTAAEAEAWDACTRTYAEIVRAMPTTLTQAEYETLCIQYGVPILDIARSLYGIQYGEFGPSDGLETMLKWSFAGTRWTTIKTERAALPKPAPRQPDYPTGRKLNCGHIVHMAAEVMSASLGTSCPDCYDRMSN